MPVREVRTSLEVGFPEGFLPERFVRFRGRTNRAIASCSEFPFEDAQFEVVMLDGSSVTAPVVKEVHRVLRPNGKLYFIVPEKTKKQEGFTLPDIYGILRYGFNIIGVERPRWRIFGFGDRTITITAEKKNWKTLNNNYRPYV